MNGKENKDFEQTATSIINRIEEKKKAEGLTEAEIRAVESLLRALL